MSEKSDLSCSSKVNCRGVKFYDACRRLLTQLEVARGVRSGGAGEGKTAAPRGPDGVILYELHSRPEQEKFTESAKVEHS